jgi:hypothetical protein
MEVRHARLGSIDRAASTAFVARAIIGRRAGLKPLPADSAGFGRGRSATSISASRHPDQLLPQAPTTEHDGYLLMALAENPSSSAHVLSKIATSIPDLLHVRPPSGVREPRNPVQ